ncbi:hypothetical protein GCM10027300_36270 [Modestobacter lapidis]
MGSPGTERARPTGRLPARGPAAHRRALRSDGIQLGHFRSGTGWTVYDQLTEEQLRGLDDTITVLAASAGRPALVVA